MFDQKTTEEIDYYVYALFDPNEPRVPFYIGKGRGNRVFTHAKGIDLEDVDEAILSTKRERIIEIHRRGQQVIHTIVRFKLSEQEALLVEAALIDMVNHILPETLTNEVSGLGVDEGFIDAADLATAFKATPLDSEEPLLLIKIERRWGKLLDQYQSIQTIPQNEIYQATRASWKVNIRRANRARFVLSVARGIVRAAYVDVKWEPASNARKAFVGRPAEPAVAEQFVGKSVAHVFALGSQNPIRYLFC